MKNNKKLLALFAAGVLSVSLFSGCSKSSTDLGGPSIDSFFAASEDNPLKDLEYVVKIDEYLVSPDEYRYVYENSKAKYAYYSGGDDIFTDNEELIKQVKDDALAMLQYNVATMAIAREKGIELSDEDMDSMQKEIDASIAQLGKENFDKALLDSYLTSDLYSFVVKQGILKEKVYSSLFTGEGEFAPSEEDLLKSAEDFVRAKHVLIKVEDEDWASGEARANEVYDKAMAGEDFDALIKEYGEDPGMTQSPEGYYFKEGQMVENFYLGAKALADNEISKPVKTDYGYHVILRLPIEDSYVKDNPDVFVSDQQFDGFYDMLEEYKLKQEVAFGEGYEEIGIDTFAKETK